MHFPYDLLPSAWIGLAYVAYALMLGAALFRAPWRALRRDDNLHVYLGTCVGLMLLWTIRADGVPGMDYHFLGATLLTLMFGWPLAILGLSLVMVAFAFNGVGLWGTLPVNLLVMAGLPVLISQCIFHCVDKRLPAHFFIYIFVGAFLSAGLAMGASILAAASLMLFSGVNVLQGLAYDYLPYTPLMIFPEAFITGMLMVVLVVFRPQWVVTFDDERYLKGK